MSDTLPPSTMSIISLILAIIALIQVWIIALYKWLFLRGKIEIHESGMIEIGFNDYGPSIALAGTLRTLNKNMFIKSIDLLITRKKDNAQHALNWRAFQPTTIDLGETQSTRFEIPAGFIVSPKDPHKFYIIFNDNVFLEKFTSPFTEYQNEWRNVEDKLPKIYDPLTSTSPAHALFPGDIKEQDRVINEFRKSKIHVDLYALFDRYFYWDEGDYILTTNVRISESNKIKILNKTYDFSISEADSKSLRLNIITLLEIPVANYLKVKNYPYNITFSVYKQQ